MAQSTLGRLWNRLAERYDGGDEADCCGTAIEEVQSKQEEPESDSCCK